LSPDGEMSPTDIPRLTPYFLSRSFGHKSNTGTRPAAIDRPTACVIAQQYSSSAFIPQGKIRRAFQNCYYFNFPFFTFLKLHKSEIVCANICGTVNYRRHGDVMLKFFSWPWQ
jgi:hypothetical protein